MNTTGLPKRVALLSSGPPISLKVLYCLHQLGIEADVVDIGGCSIVKYSRYRRKYHRLHIPGDFVPAASVEKLQKLIATNKIMGIIGGDIRSSGLVHSIKEQLSEVLVFPCSDAETLEKLDDKWLFHEFLAENRIPSPDGALLQNIDQLEEISARITFPLMIKPLFGESSHGVVRFGSLDALRDYMRSTSKHSGLPLLMQRYVEGVDADISLLAQSGRIICYTLHSRIDGGILKFQQNNEVLAAVTKIVKAANYSGVANIDVRISHGSANPVSVIECNPRFWYTLQASLWRGLNFVEAGFRAAAGDEKLFPSPADGDYYLHGYILKNILWRPKAWRTVRLYNWKGLAQAITDPLPFVVSLFR